MKLESLEDFSMLCPASGDEILAEQDCENVEEDELTADAQAAEAWVPDPSEPTDFKATFVATERADIMQQAPSTQRATGLNATWLTLGILVAFCIGVVFYLVNAG